MRDLGPDEREVDCGFCGAKAGEPCRKLTGGVSKESHQSRTNAWFAAGVEKGRIRDLQVRPVEKFPSGVEGSPRPDPRVWSREN